MIGVRNTRTGAREQRAPDVIEAWAEADRARSRLHALEDIYYALRGAFKSFARRVMDAHPDIELTQPERAALESEPPVHIEKEKQQ